MNSNLTDYIEDIIEFRTFFARFFENHSSVSGDDFHPVLHGYIYKTLSRISKEVVLWGLKKDDREKIVNFYGEKTKTAGSKVIIVDPGEEFVDRFYSLINFSRGKRGSIAFVLKDNSIQNIVEVLVYCDFIGRMSSLNQVISDHSRASVKWALDRAGDGEDVFMTGRFNGPKTLDCFFTEATATAAILGLYKYEKDKIR